MDVSFATERFQQECESRKKLNRRHGEACARKVVSRIADLEAAASLEDLRKGPGRLHELKGQRAGQLAIDLHRGKRLVIEPADERPPTKGDGGLDWARIEAVRIIEIVDYH